MACLTLVLTLTLGQRRYGDDLEVKVLDVGQGQCVLLASGGSFTLVDCGSGNHWKDPGETAARHLRAMGCYRLERLILTHYDSDHISGVESLLARMDVERILVPNAEDGGIAELARSHGVPVETVPILTLAASPLIPCGMTKSNTASCSSPELVMLAGVVSAPVVTVPIWIVERSPRGPMISGSGSLHSWPTAAFRNR